jgi:small GTP-binding protein
MADNKENYGEYKLVIAGLDNAGKTSALIALRQKYNFYERVKNLKPTIRVEYSSFDFLTKFKINLWDLGGQEKFRKIYIDNPIYFAETDYLYFLIDIQDELKFNDSIAYLQDILDIYRNMNYTNEIIICFSKHDPKFRNDENFEDRSKMLEELILIKNKDIKFKFFHISYYDISSISKAVSFSLNKILNLEQISCEIKDLVENFDCNHAILYTESGIIIADYYKETMDTREFEELISSKISDDLEFFQRLKNDQLKIDDRVTITKGKVEYVKMIPLLLSQSKILFYVGVSMNNNMINEIKVEIEKFQKLLDSLIN